MSRILTIFFALMIIFPNSFVQAAEKPTCVLMKFTDDTRYDLIESAESLSDLVMEKMIASGKFNLMETRPIDEDIEIQLYNEKMRDLQYLEQAIDSENFTPLFEGVGFDEKRAQSIVSAQVGQFIDPSITSKIGEAHNAKYLIQGTIINLGTGNWWSDDFEILSGAVNLASALMDNAIPFSALSGLVGGINIGKIGIGVQCDVRVIETESGKIIWNKRVVGVQEQTNLSLGVISIGNRKLNNNFYTKSMDKAAKKIVDAMIEEKNLFLVD